MNHFVLQKFFEKNFLIQYKYLKLPLQTTTYINLNKLIMKKITLSLLLSAAVFVANAQTARMCLVEEFTQASCGPCASQNPAFNTLLDANQPPTANKAISIKYQTSWPGVDPMNAHNPTQVATRVTYYGVSGVPHAVLDGTPQTGGSYTGAPANFTQAKIDNRQIITSPIAINVSHTINTAMDSIFITADFSASGTSTGNLVAYVVVIEREIDFATPPGSNGETEFYGIMKRMLPSDAGTVLTSTGWSLGSSQTLTPNWKLANIYNLAEVAVVAFVQNTATKEVIQAAYSAPAPIATLANASAAVVPVFSCATSLTPTITLTNSGSNALTSATISYQVDGGAVMTHPWTGNLSSGANTSVTMPVVNSSAGSHTYKAWVSMPTNPGISNNASGSFAIGASTGGPVPVTQSFSSATFPPAGWYKIDPEMVDRPWERSSTVGANGTTSSAKIFVNWNNAGSLCDLQVPAADLSAQTGTVQLQFYVAAGGLNGTEMDQLQVVVSTDCGANWTVKYDKAGSALYTGAPNASTQYVPTASEWRVEAVDLSSYIGQSNVLVRFRAISGQGNTIWVDEINLMNATGIIQGNLETSMSVYPNPSTDGSFVITNAAEAKTINIVNTLGEVISNYSSETDNSGNIHVNLNSNAAGMYLINVTDLNGKTQVTKVNVIK